MFQPSAVYGALGELKWQFQSIEKYSNIQISIKLRAGEKIAENVETGEGL